MILSHKLLFLRLPPTRIRSENKDEEIKRKIETKDTLPTAERLPASNTGH